MFSLFNPYILIGIVAIVVASFFEGHHIAYLEQEAEIVSKENSALTKNLERKENISHRQSGNNPKNILSKLEDIDNGT